MSGGELAELPLVERFRREMIEASDGNVQEAAAVATIVLAVLTRTAALVPQDVVNTYAKTLAMLATFGAAEVPS